MTNFWLVLEPHVSAAIVHAANRLLESNCPAFLESLRFVEFTFGTTPPVIQKIYSVADSGDDSLVIEIGRESNHL